MKLFKEMKWDALLTGVLYVLLGIVALVLPETIREIPDGLLMYCQ